ncbi:MDR/zinc-dependent alcohol dehydrogenase-like family protein [Mycolicibacillus parakoreensis]|uniref:SAM-dependent methyltransferase n=1 Tax=Mycolicibacillus parakoreensis TaxID=1069221 RepID=A0ABY3TX57_9MYCO|nr:hypothetical protein [Mycolicibacillus parakoreensis]ULN51454.1 hypothetical protein MIU77_11065 [Mycolicibacillus parakoreensis]
MRHGAETVDYLDVDQARLRIAESLGVTCHDIAVTKRRRGALPRRDYDVAIEASSSAAGLDAALRNLAPGGACRPVGYYAALGAKVPLMHMYANDATLRIGVSHVRPVLPAVLDFLATTGFPAETVTTMTADWEDAAAAYATRTTKLVLQRPRTVSTKKRLRVVRPPIETDLYIWAQTILVCR